MGFRRRRQDGGSCEAEVVRPQGCGRRAAQRFPFLLCPLRPALRLPPCWDRGRGAFRFLRGSRVSGVALACSGPADVGVAGPVSGLLVCGAEPTREREEAPGRRRPIVLVALRASPGRLLTPHTVPGVVGTPLQPRLFLASLFDSQARGSENRPAPRCFCVVSATHPPVVSCGHEI